MPRGACVWPNWMAQSTTDPNDLRISTIESRHNVSDHTIWPANQALPKLLSWTARCCNVSYENSCCRISSALFLGLPNTTPSVATEINREGLCLSQGFELQALDHLAFTVELLNLMPGTIVVVLILIDDPLAAVRRLLVDQGGDSRVLVEDCHGQSTMGCGLA